MAEAVCMEAGSCARFLARSWTHAVQKIGQLQALGPVRCLDCAHTW